MRKRHFSPRPCWGRAPIQLDVGPSVLQLDVGSSALQQVVEDAGLLQGPEVGDVLRDDRHISTVTLAVTVTVGQGTQEGVVLIRGEVVPAERGNSFLTDRRN